MAQVEADPESERAPELGAGPALEYQPEVALKEACRIPCYHEIPEDDWRES